MAESAETDDVAYVTALVREHDRPRYYATLFAPAASRADLFALYGFAAEVARVPGQVREAQLGEIRLRWLQDSLADAVGSEGTAQTPVLRAIAAAIRRHRLPLPPFEALIEARSADLYSDVPATVTDLEGRFGETQSALFQIAAIILGARGPETADAAGHAGIAYGVTRRLSHFASDRASGLSIAPADVLEREGVTTAELFAPSAEARLAGVIEELAELATQHVFLARTALAEIGSHLRPAFLPLAVVAPLLKRIEQRGIDAAMRDVALPDFEALVRVGFAGLFGFRQR
jgi:phytoene synthase